jgi:uncharacterized protein
MSDGFIDRASRDFIGTGWAFPPQLDVQGRIALVSQERDIDEAILLILRTRPGERPMRPEFGSLLHTLVFQSNNAATAGLARRYVQEALVRWEPRIDQVETLAGPDETNPARMLLEITYRVRATNSIRNLVFPFYTIPGEED